MRRILTFMRAHAMVVTGVVISTLLQYIILKLMPCEPVSFQISVLFLSDTAVALTVKILTNKSHHKHEKVL